MKNALQNARLDEIKKKLLDDLSCVTTEYGEKYLILYSVVGTDLNPLKCNML